MYGGKLSLFRAATIELKRYEFTWHDVETIFLTTHQVELKPTIADKNDFIVWGSITPHDVVLKKDIILFGYDFKLIRWRNTGQWEMEARPDLFRDGYY